MSQTPLSLITLIVLVVGMSLVPVARRTDLISRLGRGTTVKTVIPGAQ